MSKRYYIRALYAACVMALSLSSTFSNAACSTNPVTRSASSNLLPGGCFSGTNVCSIANMTTSENGTRYYSLTVCPNPQEMDDHCSPDVFDSGSNTCGPAPYECGVDDGKSAEECSCEEQGKQFFPIGGCGLPDDEDDQTNDRDECEASGGTYGSYNNQNVCLDEGFGVPNCSSGGNIASYQDSEGGSGWACEPDQSGNSDETDTDNDGLPDSQDTDIDNDGIPNSFDDDADGDGTPNNSDADYRGERPDQSGLEGRLDKLIDLQQNNNDKQKEFIEDAPDNFITNLENELSTDGQTLLDDAYSDALDADGSLSYAFDDSDLTGISNDVNSLFPSFACAEYNAPIYGGYGFKITCSDTKGLRDLLSWLFYAFTVFYIFSLITTPVSKD